jgi:hypothetical protein
LEIQITASAWQFERSARQISPNGERSRLNADIAQFMEKPERVAIPQRKHGPPGIPAGVQVSADFRGSQRAHCAWQFGIVNKP